MPGHPAFARLDHRPWALPAGEWSWRQSWCDLAFAHWPVPLSVVRPHVPAALDVQRFDGSAWIGIVPFRMEGVMRRSFPDVPGLSAFPELNVRTYVEHRGKPGVWFLSLDATNALAVWAARRWFHLPYHRARIAVTRRASTLDYRLQREGSPVAFDAAYSAVGEPCEAPPGTIEHFLTERYCLYAQPSDRRIARLEVHHAPWPLRRAELELRRSTMMAPWGIALDGAPALVHFAERVDVVLWAAELVD